MTENQPAGCAGSWQTPQKRHYLEHTAKNGGPDMTNYTIPGDKINWRLM